MPYSPQTWIDNNASYPVSAARMTVIENGIQSGVQTAERGHLIVTTAQRDALTGVVAGTMIYNTTLSRMQVYNGSAWENYPRTSAAGLAFVTGTNYTPSASTPIPFGAENYDTDGFHDNTTNNSRITIPTGFDGTYLFEANVMFNFTTIPTALELLIRCNGTMESTKAIRGGTLAPVNQASTASYHCAGIVYNAVAGDYFDVCLQVTGGTYGAAPLSGGTTTQTPTYFRAARLGFA